MVAAATAAPLIHTDTASSSPSTAIGAVLGDEAAPGGAVLVLVGSVVLAGVVEVVVAGAIEVEVVSSTATLRACTSADSPATT